MSVWLRGVSCRARGRLLFGPINLKVKRGECVLLCGPSGSGKTTLTRCVNGLIPSFEMGIELSGEVEVCGLRPGSCEMYELADRVGSVFQNPRSQFYYQTSDDELAFGLECAGADVGLIERRVAEVVSGMGIERLLGRDVARMSGGERQALAFASVAVADPDVYVLDEPSANLDVASIETLHAQMANVLARGKTVIIAEHRLAYLGDLIDRAILLRDGRIVRTMSPGELMGLSDDERAELGLRVSNPRMLPSPELTFAPPATSPPSTHGLSLRGLFVLRAKREVLSHLSLDVARGEVVGLVGSNGSGKTTLLRAVAGLERRVRGGILLDGRSCPRGTRQRMCSMVMQDVNHQLLGDSVRGDCELSCDDPTRIDDVLGSLDLADVADCHPMSLSGGQRQRLAMAATLLSARPVALFDEPTSGLDYRHMIEVGRLLRGLANTGACVIVATHDTELIARCCDHVYRLSGRG